MWWALFIVTPVLNGDIILNFDRKSNLKNYLRKTQTEQRDLPIPQIQANNSVSLGSLKGKNNLKIVYGKEF
jgi:hypothetical protein